MAFKLSGLCSLAEIWSIQLDATAQWEITIYQSDGVWILGKALWIVAILPICKRDTEVRNPRLLLAQILDQLLHLAPSVKKCLIKTRTGTVAVGLEKTQQYQQSVKY